jgi:hypothetical protein
MKMFAALSTLLLIQQIFGSQIALAGPKVGNGGGSWLCMDQVTLEPRWIEVTDLFESRNVLGYSIKPLAAANFREDFNYRRRWIEKHSPQLDFLLKKYAQSTLTGIDAITVFTTGDAALSFINDGLYQVTPTPASCEGGMIYFEQLADFTDEGKLVINTTLWSSPAMSEMDRSALLMHEIVYKALRSAYGDTNSVRARRIVGALYAQLLDNDIAAKIHKTLSSPAPESQDSTVEVYHSRLACQGRLESNQDPSKPTQMAILVRAADTLFAVLGSFTFHVQTDQGGSRPTSMKIVDTASGAISSLDLQTLNAAFLQNRRISLSLGSATSEEAAKLICWEETAK